MDGDTPLLKELHAGRDNQEIVPARHEEILNRILAENLPFGVGKKAGALVPVQGLWEYRAQELSFVSGVLKVEKARLPGEVEIVDSVDEMPLLDHLGFVEPQYKLARSFEPDRNLHL